MTAYNKLGSAVIVPAADLLNLVSRANLPGDARVGSQGMGKRAYSKVLRDAGSGAYAEVFALGANSAAGWRVVDGSATYLPVGIVDASWTDSAGCSYVAGLLTADGVDNPTATQDVVLKAGTYRIVGEATAEGTLADHDAPKLVVTGATDGVLLTKVYTGAFHPTAAESATVREAIDTTFTLTVDQTVTFTLSNVNEAAALEAGSSYILITLEGERHA